MWMPNIYNKAYLERYQKQAASETGKRIYDERWRIITKYVKSGTILDYGCGPNAFNKAGPNTFKKFGYDINPYSLYNKWVKGPFTCASFWDSLEHIPDFYFIIKEIKADWLFITTPNIENVNGRITDWKHYRPDEHLYYFDKYSLSHILGSLNYKIIEYNFEEGAIRDSKNPEALITVVAKKCIS